MLHSLLPVTVINILYNVSSHVLNMVLQSDVGDYMYVNDGIKSDKYTLLEFIDLNISLIYFERLQIFINSTFNKLMYFNCLKKTLLENK